MTKTLAEAQAYVEELVQGPVPAGVEVFVLPPLTALHAVRAALPDGSPVRVGVQNAHWAPDGPVTGEVSMRLVRDAGAEIVEIGHSDRRSELGETDQVVAAKVRAAMDQHLLPLVCVGEPWSARAPGRAAGYVADQVRAALAGVGPTDLPRLLIAYEPVWAIGDSGIAAAPSHIAAVLGRVRTALSGLAPGAEPLGILYGGSVTTGNAADLLRLEEVDGLFVGRAAWTPDGFAAILVVCAQVLAEREEGRTVNEPDAGRDPPS